MTFTFDESKLYNVILTKMQLKEFFFETQNSMRVMPLDPGQCCGLVGIQVALDSRAAVALAKFCNISFQSP